MTFLNEGYFTILLFICCILSRIIMNPNTRFYIDLVNFTGFQILLKEIYYFIENKYICTRLVG